MTSKNIILQSSFGSVFSTVEDIEEREGIES